MKKGKQYVEIVVTGTSRYLVEVSRIEEDGEAKARAMGAFRQANSAGLSEASIFGYPVDPSDNYIEQMGAEVLGKEAR